MILSILTITVLSILLLRELRRDFAKGVGLGLVFLVSAPIFISLTFGAILPNLTVHRILLALMLLECLRGRDKDIFSPSPPFWRFLAATAFLYALSSIASPFPLVSVKRFLYYSFEALGCFWIVFHAASSLQKIRNILDSIGFGFTVVAAFGIAERYFDVEITNIFPTTFDSDRFFWSDGGARDITATYPHRILFGLACALGALKHLCDVIWQDEWKEQRKPFVQAIICIASLYFSNSRGPWLDFLIGLFLLVVFARGRVVKWASILAALVALVLILRPGVWVTVSELTSSTFDPDTVKGSSYQWRYIVFNTALREMHDAGPFQSLFGFGGGSQIMNAQSFGKAEVAPGIFLPLASWDCEYAIILYEVGYLGFIIAIIFALIVVTKSGRLALATRTTPAGRLFIFCFISLFVIAFAKSNVAYFAPQLVFAEVSILAVISRTLCNRVAEDE